MAVGAAIKAAVADGIITFMWIFCISSLRPITTVTAAALGVSPDPSLTILFITVCLISFQLFVFGFIGHFLGGATFNPTATAAFHAVGLGGDAVGLIAMGLRFPAQALGAAGGALAIKEFMPAQYKHMLGGPSLKVDEHTGAAAELVLTFVITFMVLVIVIKGPKSMIVKNFLISACTVGLVVVGSEFTGPSMNPANAFGWAYMNDKHNTWEQLYVYWICPFIGAILAAWAFRLVFTMPGPKPGPKKSGPKKKAA